MSSSFRRFLRQRSARPNNRPQRSRLGVQHLEDRLAPAIFQVTNTADGGAGSLRDAIAQANATAGSDEITFSSLFTTPQTINLTSDQLLISDSVNIGGLGASLVTVRRDPAAATQFRIFEVNGAGVIDVAIAGMTITGGNTTGTSGGGTGGDGAGLLMFNDNVTLDGVVVTGNTSGTEGGGIAVASTNGGGAGFLTIRNSTISGNTANGPPNGNGYGGSGGGIYFANRGSLLMQNSTVSGNTTASGRGGGLYFYGTIGAGGLSILNSTISGNTGAIVAGGAYIGTITGTALVQNCTIANNTITSATGSGGGLGRFGGGAGVLRVVSSIIANNTVPAGATGPDVTGAMTVSFSLIRDQLGATITDAGNNRPNGTDPVFSAAGLANNGGPTQTIALQPASTAINAGSNPSGFPFDQRGLGFPRSVGQADIGAYEYLPPGTPTASATLPNVTTPGGAFYTFQVTFADDGAINVGTLGAGDARVTGPNGYNELAAFVGVDINSNGTPRLATYSVPAPGGTFDFADNGEYQVSIEPSQVADTNGNFVPAGALGSFQVQLPGSYTVTSVDDNGPGTLRDAIARANQLATADTIVFSSLFNTPQIISLLTGELAITNPVTIVGPGAGLLTVQRDNGAATFFRVFNVNAPGQVNIAISGMTITGGNTLGGGGSGTTADGAGLLMFDDNVVLDGMDIVNNASASEGGGIAIASVNGGGAGFLTLRNSTVSGNSANGLVTGTFGGSGGGVYFANGGSLRLENSTISGNTSVNGHGGGVYFYGTVGAGGWTTINSTVTGNTAARNGGGMYLGYTVGTTLIRNSTIAGNTATGSGGGIIFTGTTGLVIESSVLANNTGTNPDLSGPGTASFSLIRDQTGSTITDAGNNLVAGTNPQFAVAGLANNGGPTRTIALQAGSPLLNVGSNPANLQFDQRGATFLRSSGTGVDIGAFELQVPTAPTVTSTSVNGGAAQRSRVTTLAVTFSNQVTFAGPVANAFTLTRNVSGGAVGFTATANIVGGVTVVTLNAFTGAETDFASLRDGRYTLTALAAQITVGGLQLNNGVNYTFGDPQGLFRYYGDINGDRRIDIADFGVFSVAYLNPPAYNAILDFNADGRIDIADFGQFSVRYFTTLP